MNMLIESSERMLSLSTLKQETHLAIKLQY